jgi:CheY-like chemotaxis protein
MKSNIEILIVDDDPVILKLHEFVLKKYGVSKPTKSFKNARHCLNFLENDSAGNDKMYLILLDINMPEMNGWEFLDELQNGEFRTNCLVAMVTSSISSTDKKRANTYKQVISYIEKPLTLNQLYHLNDQVQEHVNCFASDRV